MPEQTAFPFIPAHTTVAGSDEQLEVMSFPATGDPLECLVTRLRPDAVLPGRQAGHEDDTGLDHTLTHLEKRIGQVLMYGTGISVRPPDGYYFDVAPRSSLSKTGHIVVNSFGVIDRTYMGEIKACFFKYDPLAPDLELPGRYLQMILRPLLLGGVREVKELPGTNRGAGGFGSTGK
jgi:deoxyuridine 5'-triphosphate nucleotidohydrolase